MSLFDMRHLMLWYARPIKLQVSFAKEPYKRDDILQKRPTILVYFTCQSMDYGLALVSRIDKITGLFCKRPLPKRRYSAKETCNFIDPTDRSHPIWCETHVSQWYDTSCLIDMTRWSYEQCHEGREGAQMCVMTHSYERWDSKYRSLCRIQVSFVELFCKRDLYF